MPYKSLCLSGAGINYVATMCDSLLGKPIGDLDCNLEALKPRLHWHDKDVW